MAKKIVLVGAGSAQFGLESVASIMQSKVLKGAEIMLHDINPEALAMVHNLASKAVAENNIPCRIKATTDRKKAVKGADFVIISIEVGYRFGLWEQDWHIPCRLGNRQVYGENGGPGGLFHSLRIIPPILDICGDIARYAPDAHIFNCSNPMSRICLAATRKYPELHFYGFCHEIANMEKHLPKMLKTPLSNLRLTAAGLNHFTILLDAVRNDTGRSAYPEIRRKALAYYKGVPEMSLVIEILKKYDYIPVTSDSHFGEYIQWAWEVADHKGIADFYRRYKKSCLSQWPKYQRLLSGKVREEWWNKHSNERVIPMIEGIVTDSGQRENAVNLPNDGLVSNMLRDCVVEVPARVTRKGVKGEAVGDLPKGLAALQNNQATVHDLTAQAAIDGSRELALYALLADPQVDSVKQAVRILDVMVRTQRKYLGYLK